MSKPPKNKKARSKPAKSGRHLPKPEELEIKSSLMKYAEEMFEFDDLGNVIKRKYDAKGIHVLNHEEDEDEELDPRSLEPKPEVKIKVVKDKKRKVIFSNKITVDDLNHHMTNPNKKTDS